MIKNSDLESREQSGKRLDLGRGPRARSITEPLVPRTGCAQGQSWCRNVGGCGCTWPERRHSRLGSKRFLVLASRIPRFTLHRSRKYCLWVSSSPASLQPNNQLRFTFASQRPTQAPRPCSAASEPGVFIRACLRVPADRWPPPPRREDVLELACPSPVLTCSGSPSLTPPHQLPQT